MKKLRESRTFGGWWNLDVADFRCSEDEYADRRSQRSITPFAVVKDGAWYERGRMGWWGVVTDEKDRDAWVVEYGKLISGLGLDGDVLLSLYDCHI